MTDNDQFLNSGKSTTSKKKKIAYADKPPPKQKQNKNRLQSTKQLPKRKIIHVATRNQNTWIKTISQNYMK